MEIYLPGGYIENSVGNGNNIPKDNLSTATTISHEYDVTVPSSSNYQSI